MFAMVAWAFWIVGDVTNQPGLKVAYSSFNDTSVALNSTAFAIQDAATNSGGGVVGWIAATADITFNAFGLFAAFFGSLLSFAFLPAVIISNLGLPPPFGDILGYFVNGILLIVFVTAIVSWFRTGEA